MTEIDELSGVELARAVAEAQGWTIDEDGIYVDAGGQLTQYDAHEQSPDVYRPDHNIAQAWEMVDELADGRHKTQHNGFPPVACCVEITVSDAICPEPVEVRVYSPTLDDVTATGATAPEAISRAYLKARAKEAM